MPKFNPGKDWIGEAGEEELVESFAGEGVGLTMAVGENGPAPSLSPEPSTRRALFTPPPHPTPHHWLLLHLLLHWDDAVVGVGVGVG